MRISDWSSDVCSSDLFAWERNISHLDDSWRLGPRTTACFAAGWLVIGALAGLDSAPGSAMVVVPGLMACALVYWVYANRLVDLAMVSLAGLTALRSEERRVGNECVSPCRSRGSPDP